MDKIERLKICAQKFLNEESCGHDFFHCLRVIRIAREIACNDFPDADIEVITAAAFMHDICRPWEKKTGISHFSEEALELIDKQLAESTYGTEERTRILDIIRWHDVYNLEKIPSVSLTDELRIHQDADRIDAIGAIGIARTFAFGGANNLPLYLPGENLLFDEHFIDQPVHRRSSVAHFYEKLLKLSSQMNTPTGRRHAEVRHARMERFLSEFFEEWSVDVGIEGMSTSGELLQGEFKG